MLRSLLAAVAAVVAGLLAATAGAQSVDVAGVKYEQNINLGGTQLQLNGYGVRYKAVFQVYAAGLYMANKAATPDAVLNAPGAKRIHLVMLRKLDANEFGRILAAGIEKNVTRDEFIQSLPAIQRMGEASAGHRVLVPGDTMTIDWVPGVGTTLYVKGKAEVGPIKEPAFFSAMAKIWLGRSPADPLLKDALLGQSALNANTPSN